MWARFRTIDYQQTHQRRIFDVADISALSRRSNRLMICSALRRQTSPTLHSALTRWPHRLYHCREFGQRDNPILPDRTGQVIASNTHRSWVGPTRAQPKYPRAPVSSSDLALPPFFSAMGIGWRKKNEWLIACNNASPRWREGRVLIHRAERWVREPVDGR